MQHNINEIYKIHNREENIPQYVTEDYLCNNGIPYGAGFDIRLYVNNGIMCAKPMGYKVAPNGMFKVQDVDGIKTLYMFGEKTWFDTEEERNEYRAQYHAKRDSQIAYNKVKKQIMTRLDEMSIEELEYILEYISPIQ